MPVSRSLKRSWWDSNIRFDWKYMKFWNSIGSLNALLYLCRSPLGSS